MPRIQTTRTVKIALFALRVYLILMLLLILFTFLFRRSPTQPKEQEQQQAAPSLSRQFRQPVGDRFQAGQLGATLDLVADEVRVAGAPTGLG